MLTDAAGRERANGDESVARALVGMQGKGVWGRLVGFVLSVLELISGLAGVIIITASPFFLRKANSPAAPGRSVHIRIRCNTRSAIDQIQNGHCPA